VNNVDHIAFWQTGRTTSLLVESGLVAVGDSRKVSRLPADARVILEKAAHQFGATHVFFRSRPGRPMVPEAVVFDDSAKACSRSEEQFALLHRRLWSWGAVPLVYRRLPGRVDVFRCAHKPDFDTSKGHPQYAPHDSIQLIGTAADITAKLEEKPWWDIRRLANGTLWDDRTISQQFLSDSSAHKTILGHVNAMEKQLAKESPLAANLRRRLLIISLLIAYLEDRKVFQMEAGFFARFKPDAEKFFHVLSDAEALINLLHYLETERFNGNVFSLDDEEKAQLRKTTHLKKFAEVIEGVTEPGGQQTLWRLYSFHDLPVELISHIYQLFVEDKTTCVYTPPFLARLMLEEALSLDRMDRLEKRNEIVFDPSCGSGVFLVEAFKRLVLHWRKNNGWANPPVEVLRKLMKRVGGTDVDRYAVELAAFSLCLAMCEELPMEAISKSRKLFPTLKGKTLIESCFFQQARENKLPRNIGVAVGNPPFGSASQVGTTQQAYNEYLSAHGKQSLPDRQSAYLFMHHCLESVVPDGLICLIQKDNFLYNRGSLGFRRAIFERWDVRQILDFTPIRGMFLKDPKVVVVMAERRPPQPNRTILHAIFRRTVHTQAELSFELDYYDMHWLPLHVILTKDFVWRCNLFGGGRTVSLVERLKKLPTLKEYVDVKGWDYGEGFIVGTAKGYELKLASVDSLDQLPKEGKALAVVATVGKTVHIRVFNPSGKLVIEKPEQKLVAGAELEALKKLFKSGTSPARENLSHEAIQEVLSRAAFVSGSPVLKAKKAIEYLYNAPVVPAKAIRFDGSIDSLLVSKQTEVYFYRPGPETRYQPPLILMAQTDQLPVAYWDKGTLTYGQRLLGISGSTGHLEAHKNLYNRLSEGAGFFRSWLTLTSRDAGIKQSTTLQKSDIDELPFPANQADLDLTENDQIILSDTVDYYRDFQRLGDDAKVMREAKARDHQEFGRVFTRQVNVVHKKLRPLPVKSWAGVSCQPFVFGKEEPDWTDADSLNDKLAKLLRAKKSPSLTTVRILRVFDGPFLFIIKPDRLRYWLKSVALRDADEALADLRALGF
jgi:N-6 DNA Methylase